MIDYTLKDHKSFDTKMTQKFIAHIWFTDMLYFSFSEIIIKE